MTSSRAPARLVPATPSPRAAGPGRGLVPGTPSPRAAGFGHPEVFAAIGALSFLVARFAPVLALPFRCPLRGLAGIPCATCGMTHAFVHLAHGEVARAVAASPAGALLAALAWAWAVVDLARFALGAPLPVPGARAVRAATAAGIALLLVNWAWLVVREAGS